MRQTKDPYATWVAEVILQQTRMDQGLPYLMEFLNAFPDVHTLAAAPPDEVLRLWQGLGYYSRARNMHASARYIVEELDGIMPGDYQGLLNLKGIGKYTAAAIASWCYNEPCPAVDGNVSRVIARLFGIGEAINTPPGEKQVYELAGALLDPEDPGKHNQAMIEFGALQCIPVSPSCGDCPLQHECAAFRQGRVEQIPFKQKNRKARERWFYYYMIVSGNRIVLVQRKAKDIWEGLYELPLIESGGPLSETEIIRNIEPLLKRDSKKPNMEPVLQERRESRKEPVLEEKPERRNKPVLQENPGLRNVPVFQEKPERQKEFVIQEGDTGYASGSMTIGALSAPIRHQLSHQTIHARFLELELEQLPRALPENWQCVLLENLDRYAMPRLIHRYLESFNF